MALVPWGEWRPDVADYNGQHSKTIENVFPRGDGYGPVKAFTALTDALPGPCRGMFAALLSSGAVAVFAGTETKLYRLNNTDYSWQDVSETASSAMDLSGALADDYFGDMSSGGDVDAAFDGTTAEAAAACSQVTAATGYVGVSFATAQAVRSVKVHGSNDAGFVSSANPSTTITLYCKQGAAPANATDGTANGSVTFTDTGDESAGRDITPTDQITRWDHAWVVVDPGSSVTINVAEVAITGADSYTALPSNDHWQFAQFSNEVIAVQGNVSPQALTLGTDVAFSDLAGSPPQAAYVTVINEFLVLSGLTSNPFRIAWSARSDVTGWTAGTDESDIQDFPDGGVVRGVAGGEYGLVFQDSAIRQMIYAPGSPLIFEFDRVSSDMGLRSPLSLVQARERVFFLSQSGFQEWSPAGGFKPIGKERWDRFFLEDWDQERKYMIGSATPKGTRIYWAYRSTAGEVDGFDRIIVYDYILERAALITSVDGQYINALAQPGVTLEGLDDISSSIDALETPLDSFQLSFGQELAVANDDNEIGLLRGSNLEAVIETSERSEGYSRVFVRGQRPVCDADSVLGSVSGRQKQSDTATLTAENSLNSSGLIPHRLDTRHFRFRNRIPAGETWTYSIGVEPDVSLTGQR